MVAWQRYFELSTQLSSSILRIVAGGFSDFGRDSAASQRYQYVINAFK